MPPPLKIGKLSLRLVIQAGINLSFCLTHTEASRNEWMFGKLYWSKRLTFVFSVEHRPKQIISSRKPKPD